ncbi:insulinase family protein [bacterium]|nr:insulinase family protein [bacterium]
MNRTFGGYSFFLFLLSLVFGAFPVFASPKAVSSHAQQPEPLSLDSLAELRKGVREHVLSNGVKVLFYERDFAPIFAGVVSVRVGGIDELSGKTGASHLFEHLAFKGTPEIGTSDFERERELLRELEELKGQEVLLQEQGKALSPDQQLRVTALLRELEEIWDIAAFTSLYRKWGQSGMNATTSKELTNYFSSFPNSSFEFWCWIESQRLTRPVARQFYKERDVVLEERRARYENRPSGKLYAELLQEAFAVHPYRHPVIGYERDLRALQPSDVLDLHREYYVASNIVVSVVGDLRFEEAIPVMEKYFGRVSSGPRPKPPVAVEPPQKKERRFTVPYDAEPIVVAAYHKPIFPDPDEVALSLFLEVAFGNRIAPLYKEIVLDKKLASEVGYFDAPGDMYPNLAVLYAEPIAPHSNAKVLGVLDRALQKMLAEPLDERRLRIAKRSLLKSALVGMKSNMGLARELIDVEQKYGSWRATLQWYREMVALTPAEVREAAGRILRRDNRTVGFLERER